MINILSMLKLIFLLILVVHCLHGLGNVHLLDYSSFLHPSGVFKLVIGYRQITFQCFLIKLFFKCKHHQYTRLKSPYKFVIDFFSASPCFQDGNSNSSVWLKCIPILLTKIPQSWLQLTKFTSYLRQNRIKETPYMAS